MEHEYLARSAPRVAALSSQWLSPLVKIHFSAFDGYMNTRLGKRYVREFLRWFQLEPDAIAYAGLLGPEPLGYVVGAAVGYQRRLNRDLAPVVAAAMALRPWLIFQPDIRAAIRARFVEALGTNRRKSISAEGGSSPALRISLVGIGVAASGRGMGMGRLLMSAFEAEAARRGGRCLRLSVYRDNKPARRLYQRCGWVLTDPGHGRTVYYEKDLALAANGGATGPMTTRGGPERSA